jgi:magnesium transporter
MKITAIKYSATMQRIDELESLEEIPALQEENFVLWIDITEPTIEELFEDKIDEIDAEVLEKTTGQPIEKIRMLIRQIRHIHRIIRGQRDVVDKLERSDTPIIKPETKIYFRDVYDHTISLLDSMESIRENAEGALEVHHSSLANKMNEIMKVLTIIATIFIPLTFITGIYGMNFQGGGTDKPLNMPELYSPYGYVSVMIVMTAISICMLIYFNRKGWL